MVRVKALLTGIRTRCATAMELVVAVWNGPYWFLVPVLCVLLGLTVFLVFLQAAPAVAPFVYLVF